MNNQIEIRSRLFGLKLWIQKWKLWYLLDDPTLHTVASDVFDLFK